MNDVAALSGKNVLIVGYGVEGAETERFLNRYADCATITVVDQAQIGPDYLKDQASYDLAIRSPGVRKDLITIPCTTATNIFFSLVKGRTIGITGTKGKSTTALITHHLISQSERRVHLVGNIGTPMLSEVMEDQDPASIWVIELSSYMLDDLRYSPSIAVAVSLYRDHLDYHGSFANYAGAKKHITAYQRQSDWFVYHPDYPEFVQWAAETNAQSRPFDQLSTDWQLPLIPGEHNRENLRGAVTAARIVGIPDDLMQASLSEIRPLPHRIEPVGTFRGISFYDDAISTTPESTIAALDAVPNATTLMLGGLDRGYDFAQLVKRITQIPLTGLVLFPDTGASILGMLQDARIPLPPICQTASMEEAVAFAFENTPPGNACLLSTAAPSYSVWKSFTEKGDLFQYWITTYANQKKNTKETSSDANKTDASEETPSQKTE